MIIDGKDKDLLALLGANSRTPTADIARQLGLSRTTVSSRINRLETQGVITGYSVRFSEDYERGRISAHVMISADPKKSAQVTLALKKMPAIRALYAVNGKYEMLAEVDAESTQDLDKVLDAIGNTTGITKTNSAILLSTKFKR